MNETSTNTMADSASRCTASPTPAQPRVGVVSLPNQVTAAAAASAAERATKAAARQREAILPGLRLAEASDAIAMDRTANGPAKASHGRRCGAELNMSGPRVMSAARYSYT